MKRQGFALPLVVVITGVIACLGYIVHTLSRHHLLTIHHFADKERAYFLAQSSLQLGRSLLDDSVLFLNQSDALARLSPPASLQPVLAPLIDAEGLIRSEEIDFFLAHPVLETIIRQNKDYIWPLCLRKGSKRQNNQAADQT